MNDRTSATSSKIEKWNHIIDQYLHLSDRAYFSTQRIAQSVHSSIQNEDFRDIKTSVVLRVTLLGILLTLTVFLFSCATPQRKLPTPNAVPEYAAIKGKEEPLYIQRNAAKIVPRVSGSETGSIYADTARPLDLYSDTAAQYAGAFITIRIPESLQFKPKAASIQKDQQKPQKIEQENSLSEVMSSKIEDLSSSRSQLQTPMTSLKMQIIGIDNGIAYLRSIQTFGNENGSANYGESPDIRSLAITAQVQQSQVSGNELSADALTNIALIENSGSAPSSYTSDGWNQNISRIVSSFKPDIEKDFRRLQDFESRVEEQQRALTERFQTLRQEQERFKKEQARFLNLRQKMEAQSSNTTQLENTIEKQSENGQQTSPTQEQNPDSK